MQVLKRRLRNEVLFTQVLTCLNVNRRRADVSAVCGAFQSYDMIKRTTYRIDLPAKSLLQQPQFCNCIGDGTGHFSTEPHSS